MKISKFGNISFSLLFNLVATFLIAMVANLVVITGYYQISLTTGLVRLFFDNIYTTGYFILLWLMNFVIFEAVKEVFEQIPAIRQIELFNHKIPLALVAGMIAIGIIAVLNPAAVFKSNFIILALWLMGYDVWEYKFGQGGR